MASAVYTAYEFSKFTQTAHHHGWLFKKSNGLKYLIPQKRYFVLSHDNLYWFKQEKTRFIFKGVISLPEAIWVGMNDKCLHLQKNADGKTYLLSGNDIEEWASILGPMLNQPEEKRASSLGKLDQKQMLSESRAYKTCPDVFSSESLAGLTDDEDDQTSSSLKRSSLGTSCGRTNSTGLENLSLPNSSAGCSVLDPNESGPNTPNFNHGAIDLEDDFLEDGLVGLPPFAQDTMERHLSQIESSIQEEIFREGAETAFTVTVDPGTPHLDEVDKPPKVLKRASSVRATVALFEQMSEQPKKRKKRKKRRARVWSQVSSAKKNLKNIKSDPSQGGGLLPGSGCLDQESNMPVIADVMDDDETDSVFWTDSESSLSDVLSRKNLESERTLDELATSLKSMMDTLNNLTSSIQSQTMENLCLFNEATNTSQDDMFTDEYLDEYHKQLRKSMSDPQFMRIPTSQLASDFFSTHRRSTLDPSLHRGSSLWAPPSLYRDDSYRSSRCSDAMYSRGSTLRIPNSSVGSQSQGECFQTFYSEMSFMDSDSFDDLESEDFDDILTEDVQDVADYIRDQITLQKSVSMVNLANQFKHKQLTLETLKNLYSTVRGRLSIDNRVKRRQAHENVSDLSLIFDYFCNTALQLDTEGLKAMFCSDSLQRQVSVTELLYIKTQMVDFLPMITDEFAELLEDLPPNLALRMRLGLEEHVRIHSPIRRIAMNISEFSHIIFQNDGLTVDSCTLECIQPRWCLVKINGNTIFSESERNECLLNMGNEGCFLAEFVVVRE